MLQKGYGHWKDDPRDEPIPILELLRKLKNADRQNVLNKDYILKRGCTHGSIWNPETFTFATKCENMELLEWLVEKKCPWDETATRSAASMGNSEMLKWLIDKGCPCDEDVRNCMRGT